MHFIFGYQREIPVKIEGKVSRTALVVLAVLIISFFIFLSFENLSEETKTSPVIFNGLTYFAWQGSSMNGFQNWVQGGLIEPESPIFNIQDPKSNLEF
jgi:hypothetical protein